MSEVQTGFSKRFALEILTGETKTEVTSIGSRFTPSTKTRQVPITKRFPPDRIRSFVTRTTYTKDDSTGKLTNPNVKVYQEVSIDQWNSLPDNLKTSDPKQLKYYAQIAEIPSGQRNYIPTDQVIDVLYNEKDAKLLKNEATNYNNGKGGQFKTVSRVANETALKNEGIDPNKPDARGQLGLGKDGPTDNIDEKKEPLTKPEPFNTPQQINQRKQYPDARYPSDLKSEMQDVIKFTQLEYGSRGFTPIQSEPDPNNPNSNRLIQANTGFTKRILTPLLKGSVTLPIQDQISDTNMVNWGSDELNPAQAFAAARLMDPTLSIGNIATKTNAVADELQKLIGTNTASEMSTFLKAYFIQNAVQSQTLFSRATGAILNPNVELLFRAPQLRPFNFSFLLTARDDEDAKQIKQIIRFFKQGMSVKNTATDIFLRAPNVFKIEYKHNNQAHPGLNLIKECALTNCNVQYTPANTYSTFEDGTMTAYKLSLQFTELEPVTEADYKEKNADGKVIDLPDNVIGY